MTPRVRNGLEVRVLLGDGLFTKRRFFKMKHTYGVTHSFNGSKEHFRNEDEAQKALDKLLEKPNAIALDSRGNKLWPVTREEYNETHKTN